MTERALFIKHMFAGGWATDFGPTSDVTIQGNSLSIPYLLDAENLIYLLDGGTQKSPGTAKLNGSALESGAVIKGLFDYWITGSGGASTQHRIIHVNTVIKKDDADGSFSDIFTGLQAGKIPSYSILEDLLIMSSDSTTDVPKTWDGSTAQNLAGSPPNFAFSVEHKGRVVASGNAAAASRVYYTSYLDPENWTGLGSGFIDISPSDGDRITGLASHQDALWIFKGPYKGSIHRVTGSSPADFGIKLFIKGISAATHNTIFHFKDDLGFMWSDGSVHSLSSVAAFGDFSQTELTLPIQSWIREHINFSRIKHFWTAVDTENSRVLFSIAVDGSTNNNYILTWDFRFNPPRWASWPAYAAGSLAQVTDSDRKIIMAGGNDGFVRKYGEADRSIDGITTISYKLTTPFLNYGNTINLKTLSEASLSIAPKNNGNIIFGWQRDGNAQQTYNISQGGGDVLGTATTAQFTLDTSVLAGGLLLDRFAELHEGGEFRSIQYQLTNAVNLEDVEVHSLSTALIRGGWSTEET